MVRGFHTLTCMGVFNHGNECLGHLEVLLIYLNWFFFFSGWNDCAPYIFDDKNNLQEFVGMFEFI